VVNGVFEIPHPCAASSYAILPTSQTFSSDGGQGSVAVTTGGACTWSISNGITWITIISSVNDLVGSGSVIYEVQANTNSTPRSGTFVVADRLFTVTQAAAEQPVSLSNGVPFDDQLTGSASTRDWKYYFVDIPSGVGSLKAALYNLTGDLDLHVRYNAKPTLLSWDCRPYESGTDAEVCTIPNPAPGRWWFGINNYDIGQLEYTLAVEWAIAPRLAIERTGSSIVISWPTGQGDYLLEASATLDEDTLWEELPDPAVEIDGRNTVTLSVTPQSRFFRLVKP
jgi:hypothetical protein